MQVAGRGSAARKQPKLRQNQATHPLEPYDLGSAHETAGVDDDVEAGLTDAHNDLWRRIVRLVDGPPALPVLGPAGDGRLDRRAGGFVESGARSNSRKRGLIPIPLS
jgi:hypothetical protein